MRRNAQPTEDIKAAQDMILVKRIVFLSALILSVILIILAKVILTRNLSDSFLVVSTLTILASVLWPLCLKRTKPIARCVVSGLIGCAAYLLPTPHQFALDPLVAPLTSLTPCDAATRQIVCKEYGPLTTFYVRRTCPTELPADNSSIRCQ